MSNLLGWAFSLFKCLGFDNYPSVLIQSSGALSGCPTNFCPYFPAIYSFLFPQSAFGVSLYVCHVPQDPSSIFSDP